MTKLSWLVIEKILNVAFSFGAAVVIFGATAKILHWKNADISIMVGLLTEVAIFLTMGLVEAFKPKETPGQISNNVYANKMSQQLPSIDISQELLTFRSNLEKINKKMENILNSSK